MLRKSRKQLTTRFLHRTVLFSTSFSAGLVLFYLFGNVQEFMDSTQILLLSVLSGTALVTVMLSLTVLVLEIALRLAGRQRLHPVLVFVHLVCLGIGTALSFASNTIILLSRGL
jgi:hypothetical protein